MMQTKGVVIQELTPKKRSAGKPTTDNHLKAESDKQLYSEAIIEISF